MILEQYIRENRQAFEARLSDIADKLGINPDWLMAVMYKESGIWAQAVNRHSGAVGLIQFMPKTAEGLGTSADALLNMTNVEQLHYVYLYFRPYARKIRSYRDAYLAVFFPVAIDKPDNWVLQAKNLDADTVARWNPGVDLNDNMEITVGEFERYALGGFPTSIYEYLKKK